MKNKGFYEDEDKIRRLKEIISSSEEGDPKMIKSGKAEVDEGGEEEEAPVASAKMENVFRQKRQLRQMMTKMRIPRKRRRTQTDGQLTCLNMQIMLRCDSLRLQN